MKSKEPKQFVKRDMLLGDCVQKYPEAAFVMMHYGLHCVGCHVAAYETIEQGAMAHGLDDAMIDKMVKEINELIGKEQAKAKK